MPDEATVRSLFRRHWEYAGTDQTIAHEIYHVDAVLEFPQSGERFVGKAQFQGFRERYPAKLDFKIRRVSGSGDFWVAENLIRYDDGEWMFTVNIARFRGDKIATEWIYIMDGWEAPDWRAPYREMFDPLTSLEPGSE
jgi:hypothetical protein